MVISGVWLLIYRLFIRTKLRRVVEILTHVLGGASWAILAPLSSWPSPIYRIIILTSVGALLSALHPALLTLTMSVSIGIAFSAAFWQVALCTAVADSGLGFLHPVLLTIVTVCFTFFFTCTSAGPSALERFLVPLLGSLMLTVGLAGLLPAMQGLSPDALMAETPCAGIDHGLIGITAWFIVAALGMKMQAFLMRPPKEETNGEDKNTLVHSLLPDANDRLGGGKLVPKPGPNDRFALITKAMFADEGDPVFDELSDHERKLVEVCRKDEFERDRVLWGGGLI